MILLLTPPMVQVNAPYAATPLLAGFLRDEKIPFEQRDLSLELALRLFSQEGLKEMRGEIVAKKKRVKKGEGAPRLRSVEIFLEEYEKYFRAVGLVVRFLQTHDPALSHRIAQPGFLPDGWRLMEAHGDDADDELFRLFGQNGTHDRATYLASLFLDEIADVARDAVDPHFCFSRYGESLAQSLPTFDPVLEALKEETLVTRWIDGLVADVNAPIVAITCPFPGTLLAAFRIARCVKSLAPATKVVLGGGYPSTELRELDDPRVFDFFDAVVLDDGRGALRDLWKGKLDVSAGRLVVQSKCRQVGASACRRVGKMTRPDFTGLRLGVYLSLVEMPNPMHRLWSDACWLKLPLTSGCHWGKCAFCDTSLPHIKNFSQPDAKAVVASLRACHEETGRSVFHFTDEALPPKFLAELCDELKFEKFTWWGNIRFERGFTRELAQRMADAGCVAVTGGLECANDRLLALMKKGVTLKSARAALQAFADAGIMTHAYLIYGFPTQTFEEVLGALDFVRGCFCEGVLQSAFWHRFTLTAHSPILARAEEFGIVPREEVLKGPRFARNALAYDEKNCSADWDAVGKALHRATYNYMMGTELYKPVEEWFES